MGQGGWVGKVVLWLPMWVTQHRRRKGGFVQRPLRDWGYPVEVPRPTPPKPLVGDGENREGYGSLKHPYWAAPRKSSCAGRKGTKACAIPYYFILPVL